MAIDINKSFLTNVKPKKDSVFLKLLKTYLTYLGIEWTDPCCVKTETKCWMIAGKFSSINDEEAALINQYGYLPEISISPDDSNIYILIYRNIPQPAPFEYSTYGVNDQPIIWDQIPC